jgi:hypothetical protein
MTEDPKEDPDENPDEDPDEEMRRKRTTSPGCFLQLIHLSWQSPISWISYAKKAHSGTCKGAGKARVSVADRYQRLKSMKDAF